jgi:imidazolonepropionase-like amidohydrolase
LFDAHTHLCLSGQSSADQGNYYFTTLLDPDSFRAIQGVANARAMLESGFTTVRDVGNEGNFACSSLRRAISQGLVPGPTIINAGRIIAPYGGQFHLQPDKPKLAEPEYFFADTRDEMIKGIPRKRSLRRRRNQDRRRRSALHLFSRGHSLHDRRSGAYRA